MAERMPGMGRLEQKDMVQGGRARIVEVNTTVKGNHRQRYRRLRRELYRRGMLREEDRDRAMDRKYALK